MQSTGRAGRTWRTDHPSRGRSETFREGVGMRLLVLIMLIMHTTYSSVLIASDYCVPNSTATIDILGCATALI